MFTLIAQNKYGEQLELTHNSAYVIESIDGIDPPDAIINTTRNANADGSVFNSAYIDNRTITITLAINGPAEPNRIALYQYFKSKYPVRLYYQNGARNVYVQNITIGFFEKKQIAQIVVVCPNPLFNGVNDSVTDFSHVEDLFEFPFEVSPGTNLIPFPYYNQSKTANGITWTVNDDGTVTADGTATARTDFFMAYNATGLFGPGDYTLSGCPENGSNSTYRVQMYDVTNRVTYNDFGEGVTFTIDDSNLNSEFRILASVFEGTTVNDLVFKPIVNVGDTAEEYEPYEAPGIEFSRIIVDNEESVLNGGDVDSGVIITIQAVGTVVNPAIYNLDTNESFVLNYTMAAGDEIIINTHKKQKSVVLISGGVTTNLIGYMENGSTWFQLVPGDNLFTVNADSMPENMEVSFTVTNQFEGV